MQRLKDGWTRETLSRLTVPSHGTWYLSTHPLNYLEVCHRRHRRREGPGALALDAVVGDREDGEGGELGQQGGQSMAGGLAREGCWGPAPLCCLTAP